MVAPPAQVRSLVTWIPRDVTSRPVVRNALPGLSARSIVKYHVLLHSIFARAVADRLIAFNPCKVLSTRRSDLTWLTLWGPTESRVADLV